MKTKLIARHLAFCLLLVMFIIGCSEKPAEEQTESTPIIDGEELRYQYESYGLGGPGISDITASDDAIESTEETQRNETDMKFTAVNEVTIQQVRKIVKAARMRLKAQKIEQSKTRIDSLVKTFNVTVDKEEYSNSENSLEYRMTFRIQEEQYDRLLAALKSTRDELKYLTSSVTDVTEDYFDLELRRNNEKTFLATYNDLLRKAGDIKEVLKVQEKIQELTEEIESKNSRLQTLDNISTFSTIHLVLYEEKEAETIQTEAPGFISRLSDSFGKGWQSVVEGFLWLISKWSVILGLTAGYFVLRKLIRNYRRKKEIQNT